MIWKKTSLLTHRSSQARDILIQVITYVKKVEREKYATTAQQILVMAANDDDAALAQSISRGFAVDTADPAGRTALMAAAANGSVGSVRTLLHFHAQVSMKDNFGNSALLDACRGGHDEVLKLLAAAGGSFRDLYWFVPVSVSV